MSIVDLEIVGFEDLRDEKGAYIYTVIQDIERRQAVKVNAKTRKEVAEENKDATIAESDATKAEEMKKAENEEAWETRKVKKEETIEIQKQEKEMNVQKIAEKANEQLIAAQRTKVVGEAQYNADATVKKAEGNKKAKIMDGEGLAEYTEKTGGAEATVIRLKGESEGKAIDAKAEAQKKYQTEAALKIEILKSIIDGFVTERVAMYENYGKALEKAEIQILSTGEEEEFLGFKVGPKGGRNLGAFIKSIEETTGINVAELFGDVAKTGLGAAKRITGDKPKLKPKQEPKKTEEGQ